MKTRFSLFAFIVLILFCLSGCQSKISEQNNETNTDSALRAEQTAEPVSPQVSPVPVESAPADSTPVQTAPAESEPSESAPAEPVSTEPASAEPTPFKSPEPEDAEPSSNPADLSADESDEMRGRTVEEMLADMQTVSHDVEENGIWYGKKKNVSAYLFMGIDLEGEAPEKHTSYIGGQSDALFLLVIDDNAKTRTVIQINRDTMTDVEVLDYYGVPTGVKVRQQICLSHTYGDGTEPSCENVVRTVSALLDDIEISGYLSISYDAVSFANDALGGVTVPIEDDFSKMDPSLVLGENVTLIGEQAEHFVRGRQTVGDGSNLSRERRQRVYLNAFKDRFKKCFQENSCIIDEVYRTVKPYMVANMNLSELSSLAMKCMDYADGGIISPKGSWQEIEYSNKKTYVEYVVDESALHQLVLQLFYEPAE